MLLVCQAILRERLDGTAQRLVDIPEPSVVEAVRWIVADQCL
jgi:hypothetical protein